MTGTCQGCGVEIPPSRGPRARKWCGEPCRRRTLYAGTCVDCGALTDGSNGKANAPRRCITCTGIHERQMSHRYIIDSINEWADLFGVPPTVVDWNLQHASALGRLDRIERYEQTGRPWPAVSTVQAAFGSWNAGIAAAGWEPRPVGTYGRDGEDDALCEQIAALYREGRSSPELAQMFGCSEQAIRERLEKVGQPRRSMKEAAANRWARAAA